LIVPNISILKPNTISIKSWYATMVVVWGGRGGGDGSIDKWGKERGGGDGSIDKWGKEREVAVE
jgi:hypothetical protein